MDFAGHSVLTPGSGDRIYRILVLFLSHGDACRGRLPSFTVYHFTALSPSSVSAVKPRCDICVRKDVVDEFIEFSRVQVPGTKLMHGPVPPPKPLRPRRVDKLQSISSENLNRTNMFLIIPYVFVDGGYQAKFVIEKS